MTLFEGLEKIREVRSASRYTLQTNIDISRDGARLASGAIINISRGGVAFRTPTPLTIGETYWLNMSGVGAMGATIVRKFNINCYGAQFQITASERDKLDEVIFAALADENEKQARKDRKRRAVYYRSLP